MNKIGLVFIFSAYFQTIFCISEEMQELIASLHSTCMEETGVSEELISKVNDAKILPDDEKLKCYINCLMTQTGCISEDGIVDVEATIAILPDEIRDISAPVIQSCGAKRGANPCDSAWLTHKCYLEAKPDVSNKHYANFNEIHTKAYKVNFQLSCASLYNHSSAENVRYLT